MTIRSAPVAIAAIVLGLIGSVALLLVDHGPDPDDPGYTEGQARWSRPFSATGSLPLERSTLVDGQPACLRWTFGGRFVADVAWRGSRADAEVQLTSPRLTRITAAGRLTATCDSTETLPTSRGVRRVDAYWEMGGGDDATCGWEPRVSSRRARTSGWCGDEDYRTIQQRLRMQVLSERPPRFRFDAYGNPVALWGGEASAEAGGDDPFEAPLCFAGHLGHDVVTETPAMGGSTGYGSKRFPVCVDLWEPTPWGDDDRN